MRVLESDIKQQVKDYLAIKGIFNFPLLQGLGSAKGLPDRVMHYKEKVHYLEIKKPKGKLSLGQQDFGEQCAYDDIDYVIIRSLDDLIDYLEGK